MDAIDLAFYRHQGHLTVDGVFGAAETDALIADIESWGESFLAGLPRRAARLVRRRRRQGANRAAQARQPARAPAGSAAGRSRSAPGRARRADPRRGRLGLLQPGLLQGARGRRPEAGAPGQFLLRPDRPRRHRHGVDRARRRDARERLPLLRRRHEPRAGLRPRRSGRRAVQPAVARGRPRQAADGAGAGAKGRRELSSRQHLPPVGAEPQQPTGVGRARCTTSGMASSSRRRRCRTTTR